jgi:hypothetical protein
VATELFTLAPFAKNDWGSVFWAFAFLSFFLRREKAWLIGLAAGASFSAKYTEVFFLFPLLLWELWLCRRDGKKIAKLALGFGIAIFPLALRNAVFTGNPFFPALEFIFPSPMGPSWKNISYYEGITFQPHLLAMKLRALWRENQVAVFSPLLFLFFPRLSSRMKRLFLSALCSSLLFLFLTGEKAEWRLAGAALVCLSAFGFTAIETTLRKFPLHRLTVPACALGALALSPVEWRAPIHLLNAPDPSLQIREYVSGAALAWIRLNAPTTSLAATLNEQRIYYFSPFPPLRAFDWPELDSRLEAARSPEEAVDAFREKKIRYLVLSAEFLDRYFNRKVCDWIYALSEKHPNAVVFRAPLSRVLDLDLLEK